MKQMYTAQLQQEIVQVFGHPVLSASDCAKLAEEVFEKTGLKISVNTLRRFFNLIKAKYPPSYNTLTILSKACGFQSFSEFAQLCESQARRGSNVDAGLLRFMVSLFQQINVAHLNDETYNNVVRLTIVYLKSNQDAADAFQKRIAHTKNGQDFYFERFINTDYLNGFYGNGLRYYLNEKRDPKAQLFGHSLLCFRYWLTQEDAAFEAHYKHLNSTPLHATAPPVLQAYYFCTRLLHAHIHQVPAAPAVEEARSAFNQFAHTKEYGKTIPRFEMLLAAALVLTQQFDEAIFYINQVNKRKPKYNITEEEGWLFVNLLVYEALAWAGMGKPAKAEAIYDQLKAEKFYFLDQKYMSLLFMQLERLLKKRKFREEKFDFLIKETGFRRLRNLFF